jgi:hypothetical protein
MELSPKYTEFSITKQAFINIKKLTYPCILSDHNAIKVELSNKRTAENTQTPGD